MMEKRTKASGTGLERSCAQDWLQSASTDCGVELLEAYFHGGAYHKHRHDTYAICLTTAGVQAFDYRGTAEISLPGQVVVLHPDEAHDGHAGTAEGFGYRMLYVDPAQIFDALYALRGRPSSLPFVRVPVVMSHQLSGAIVAAFRSTREPLAIDRLVIELAEGLMEADPAYHQPPLPPHIDVPSVRQAREYLDAQKTRVVRSAELEAVTGLSRYELARQFRVMYGTSPYRYLLMRRLDWAREQLRQNRSLVEVAIMTGFADQAHFSRMFKSAVGMTPAYYRALGGHSEVAPV